LSVRAARLGRAGGACGGVVGGCYTIANRIQRKVMPSRSLQIAARVVLVDPGGCVCVRA
jgi:hypothetical protein